MRPIFLPLLMASLVAVGLHAGKGTQTGSGKVSRPPEFVTLNLNIVSECYTSPDAANQANNDLTKEVQNILQKFVSSENPVDRVYSEGGLTYKYSGATDVDGVSNDPCNNTFKQSSQVTFVTGNIKNFSDIYAAIQTQVYSCSKTVKSSSFTYVTIDRPSADVCDKTRWDMQYDAIQLATKDAQIKFAKCAQKCGIDLSTIEITGINEGNVSISNLGYESRMSDANGPVNINFHDISESSNVTVTFEFANGKITPDICQLCPQSNDCE